MNNKKVFTVFILFFFMLLSVFPQSSQYEKNVLDFNVQGIKLGSSLKDFLANNKFSSEYISKLSDLKNNKKVYVSSDVPNIDKVVFRFFDDKLYEVRLIYHSDTLNKMGGGATLLKNLVNRYGQKFDSPEQEDKNKVFEGYMKFENINRYIWVEIDEDGVLLMDFTDTFMYSKMRNKQSENANFGF